jgi:hypothetical protein
MSSTFKGEKKRLKAKLLEETYGRVCFICGGDIAPHEPLSIDHIIPISVGGSRARIENLQLAHQLCNLRKSNHCEFSLFGLKGMMAERHIHPPYVQRLLRSVEAKPIEIGVDAPTRAMRSRK